MSTYMIPPSPARIFSVPRAISTLKKATVRINWFSIKFYLDPNPIHEIQFEVVLQDRYFVRYEYLRASIQPNEDIWPQERSWWRRIATNRSKPKSKRYRWFLYILCLSCRRNKPWTRHSSPPSSTMGLRWYENLFLQRRSLRVEKAGMIEPAMEIPRVQQER